MTLWCREEGFSERNARKLLTTLGRKAMLTVQGERAHRRVSFHDLQQDYLRAVAGDGIATLHARLLDAYRPATGSWSDLPPEEPYLWTWLCHHLGEAGRHEELKALLFNPAWIVAKLHAAGIVATMADYDTLHADEDVRLVRHALTLSAHVLTRDHSQLPGQLVGRLRGLSRPAMTSLCAGLEGGMHRARG